jgi:hypothetical protein
VVVAVADNALLVDNPACGQARAVYNAMNIESSTSVSDRRRM